MSRLLILNDQNIPEHVLTRNTTIGRLPECHLTLADETISRFHCLISFKTDKGFFIKDLGSENGTFVNDDKLRGEYLLCDGDIILLGSTRLVFKAKRPSDCVGYIDEPADAFAGKIELKTDPLMASRFLNIQDIKSQAHLKADYERLRIAYEIFKDIGIDNDLDTILGLVLNRIFEILVFDRGIALLLDKDGGFENRAYKTKHPDEKITVSSQLISHIADTRQSILVKDISADKRFKSSASLVAQGARATLAVPVILDNELFGMLIIDSTT